MVRAAKRLKEVDVDLVAMDCIGYTVEKKRTVQKATRKPVVLVRSVLASIIREIAS
jgi:protein AroM